MKMYDTEVAPALPALRQSVIHNDANDYNVLVSESRVEPREVVSVIDFGDMLHTNTVGEVAVAAAYALLGEPDPLAAAAQVVAGYHSVFPLQEKEVALLYPLICARLCVSVTNSAYRKTLEPDDPYVTISEQPAWDALQRLAALHPRFAHYTFRHACGLPPVPGSEPVVNWLRAHASDFASVVRDLRQSPSIGLSYACPTKTFALPTTYSSSPGTTTTYSGTPMTKCPHGVSKRRHFVHPRGMYLSYLGEMTHFSTTGG